MSARPARPLPPRTLRLAACAWALDWHADDDAFAARLSGSIAEAAGQGADITVLPEYAGLEAVFTGPRVARSVAEWCARAADHADRYAALCATLAQRHRLTLLSGSLPARRAPIAPGPATTGPARSGPTAPGPTASGPTTPGSPTPGPSASGPSTTGPVPSDRDPSAQDAPDEDPPGVALVNRAFLCRPDGRVLAVDKQILTPWEREATPLSPGDALPVLDTDAGRIAALICYDAEFPPLARALEADLLLVPSCTEAPAGAARVRAAARARALEGQAVAIHAPLLGAIPECEIVDANTGRAAIFGPPDHGFPDSGILAEATTNAPGWVVAELPIGALSHTRAAGAVRPRADMAEAESRAHAAAQGRRRQEGP